MCKIIAFTNSSKLDIKKTSEAIGEILLGIEKDGYGYAVQGAENVFGEKCIAPKFSSRLNALNIIDLPIVEKRQEVFGHADKPTGPAIFHGRTSTNDRGLLNCHPMQRKGWHLIHNGVVTDHGAAYKKTTTNDSEDLLHRLTLGIGEVEKHLSGYYAFCAIDPKGRLHVARDTIASLYMALVPKLDSYIIATTEAILEATCKKLKLKFGPIDKLAGDTYSVFDKGVMVSTQVIKPRGYDRVQAQYATLSLGRTIEASSYGAEYDLIGGMTDQFTAPASAMEEEEEVAELMQEIAELDDSYEIKLDGMPLSAREFYKLDNISQLACEIYRADGSRMELEVLA